jgi:hypothetical protein
VALTAGVWGLAGFWWALVALALVGTPALLAAEWVLDDPDAPDPAPRWVERVPPPRRLAPAREPARRRWASRLRQLGALVPRTRPRLAGRARYLLAGVAAVLLATLLTLVAVQGPARADSATVTGNPVVVQMTDPDADGLVVHGTTGTNNPLIVYDPYLQPIVAVGEYGGFKVFGDCSAVNRGDDVYHSQVTLCADEPNPAVCVRNGQLWIGGVAGKVWRCADLDGGAWNGGWWEVL